MNLKFMTFLMTFSTMDHYGNLWLRGHFPNECMNIAKTLRPSPFHCVRTQGLPGDGRNHAAARKCPQNDPWVVVNSARKKKNFFKAS
jgi:hypothetical protein